MVRQEKYKEARSTMDKPTALDYRPAFKDPFGIENGRAAFVNPPVSERRQFIGGFFFLD
jgi:hypothetical protein